MLGEITPTKQIHFIATILDNETKNTIVNISVKGARHFVIKQTHNPRNDAIHNAVFNFFEIFSWLLAAIIPNRNGAPQPIKLCRIQLDKSLPAAYTMQYCMARKTTNKTHNQRVLSFLRIRNRR